MKKHLNFLGSLLLLLFISSANFNLINAQTGDRLPLEKGEQENNASSLSGDVDPSLIDNLFTSYYQTQGSRASVFALARQNDGKILVTGNFSYANGAAKSLLVRLNPNESVDTSFNFPSSVYPISQAVPLANGKILISGSFSTTINGITYSGLAQLNEDGSLDDNFTVNVNGISQFVVQPDGKIVIAGGFSTVSGFAINSIARLNKDGSLDTSFQVGSGANNSVFAVAVQPDGKILIGGYFTSYNNVSKSRMARLNTDGSLDTTFSVGDGSSASGPNSSVYDIIIQPDNKILIGGAFYAVNGAARNAQIARLETNGTLDNSFNPVNPLNNTSGVRIALQPDGKILAGFIANLPTNSTLSTLYRYNSDGSLDTSFNSAVNAPVSAFLLEGDGKIIIGGAFTTVNGNFKNAVARLNPDGTTDNSFNYVLGFAALSNAIAVQPDGKILVSGNFEYVNQAVKNGFVRLNADGSVDQSFNVVGNFANGSFANISTIVPLANGKILIGGNFTIVNGQSVNRITRLNSDGSLDSGFNVGGIGPNGTVLSIAVQTDEKILATGNFYTFNNTPRQGVVRLEKNGAVDPSFVAPFSSTNGSVPKVVLQPDGKILLGGGFTLTNGAQRSGVVRLNSNGSLDDGFNSSSNYIINDIVVQPDGKILVGGNFSGFNGVSMRNIARLNTDGSVDTTFNVRSGANSTVSAIILQSDGKILIGGDFTTVNGIRRGRLARLNSDGSLDDFDVSPGANLPILDLAQQSDGRLLVGGSFTQIGGLQRVGFARIRLPQNNSRTPFDFDGDGKTDFAVFRAAAGAWYKLNSSAGNSDGRLFGLPTDRIVPGDYDGDGKTDLAVWRPSSGYWFILKSTTSEVIFEQFGGDGDRPLAADFDGDGKADLAVFRPSNGVWYISQSRDGFRAVQFGASTDVPLIGDFDGDGKADVAVYRPSSGAWYILPSAGGFSSVTFGAEEDIPVPGDYDGDGKTDFAVWRPSNGTWYVLGTTQGFSSQQFGAAADRPVPGDYDGDGKTDVAVFRPSSGSWYVSLSSNKAFKSQNYGAKEDLPIPSAFLR